MRAAVRKIFVEFNEPLEGIVYSIYADIKSLPTTGMGNLLPTSRSAQLLPFRRPDGSLATAVEKAAEWDDIVRGACGAKALPGKPDAYKDCLWVGKKHPQTGRPCFAHLGWRASEGAKVRLKLSRADVDALVNSELTRFWRELKTYFPDIDTWPAAAQLGLLSMAWALGPAFSVRWPRFTRAARVRDFATCSRECSMQGGGTIPTRNARNRQLFEEAAVVESHKLDPEVLHWPNRVAA